MPVYNVEHEAFKTTLESVLAQTYGNWELCVADGGENKVDAVIDEVMGDDARIRYVSLEANLGISGNSNQALDVASGEYVAFLDHDDILEPDALYEAANRIVNYGADMVYTDEDKVSPDLKRYFKPYRKPDYNKTLLLSNNYICHFCVINRKIVTEAGGFRSEYDGAQDYDLFLRCVDKCKVIEHVDKILYHWNPEKIQPPAILLISNMLSMPDAGHSTNIPVMALLYASLTIPDITGLILSMFRMCNV